MPKVIKLDKKQLEKLYLVEKRGSYEVAKILKCSASHVRDSLREYSIKSRSVQEAKALTKPRHKRHDFNGNLKEKAYLIGFRIGDLHVSKTHPNSPTIRVGTNTTKQEQLRLIRKLFSPYGYVKEYPRDKNGAVLIRSFVNNTFDFLLKKEDAIEPWILKNNNLLAYFVAGYTDAEGTFCISSGRSPVFSIKSQDKKVLFGIHEFLDRLGLKSSAPYLTRKAGSFYQGVVSNKDVYGLFLYKRSYLKLLITKLLPLLRHKKRRKDALKVLQYVRS